MISTLHYAVKPKFRSKPLDFALSTCILILHFPAISFGQGPLPTCPEPSPQAVQVRCAEFSFHYKYRMLDGSCNNLGRPHWGSAGVPLLRLLPPQYDDVANQPLGNGGFGDRLPNARLVSQIVMAAHHKEQDIRHSAMLAHWGQFLAHDLSLAKEAEVNCSTRPNDHQNCFNIHIPPQERELRSGDIFPFRRSLSCTDGGLREQVNRLTAFIDASQVYGNTRLSGLRIRERFPLDRGLLRENPLYRSQHGRPFLVFDESGEMVCHRNKSKVDGMECFLSGDPRANEQLLLTALHTVTLREHNRIARALGQINPEWAGETVFQETRKIVAAIFEHITLKEWLPKILGPVGMEMLGEYEGYDPSVNPGIANAIAAAVLRFGHTMVVPELSRRDAAWAPGPGAPSVRLREAFFAPESLIQNNGIEPLLRGAVASPVKAIQGDAMVTVELTNHLFPNAHTFPLDLAAMNIQRGRDHALPLYNEWRSLCGLERIQSWEQFAGEARDARAVQALARLYTHPRNLDLWVGGLLEKPLRGGKLGRTFSCLLSDQFKRLRSGDRHWYENPGVFGLKQVENLRQYSMAKLLCHNLDDTFEIPSDAFVLYPGGVSQFARCTDLPDLDLHLWRIDGDGFAGSFECSSADCTCRYQVGAWGRCKEGVQKRFDLLVQGQFPPCTSQRELARPCPNDSPPLLRRPQPSSSRLVSFSRDTDGLRRRSRDLQGPKSTSLSSPARRRALQRRQRVLAEMVKPPN